MLGVQTIGVVGIMAEEAFVEQAATRKGRSPTSGDASPMPVAVDVSSRYSVLM